MKRYCRTVLDACSVLLSAILGGGKRMSISQRLGEVQKFGGPKILQLMRIAVDWFFLNVFNEQDHCYNSLIGPLTSEEKFDFTGGRKGPYVPDYLACNKECT